MKNKKSKKQKTNLKKLVSVLEKTEIIEIAIKAKVKNK